MKTRATRSTPSTKPALAALLAAKNARNKTSGSASTSPASLNTNTALNGQNRRVLAQHYRAKYGVK